MPKVGSPVGRGSAGHLLLMLGKSTTDLLNSIKTGTITAAAEPLSCPANLPGDYVGIRADTAPLNSMSYFSSGSIVRL